MIAAVCAGKYANYEAAVADCVAMTMSYQPNPPDRLERKYRRFCALYNAALEINAIV